MFNNDLIDLCDEESVLFFPSSYKRSVQYDNIENTNIVQRTEILSTALFSSKKSIIISYPEAIIEKIVSTEGLRENTLTIQKGESLSVDFLIEVLNEYKFERTDFVYEPGQFSVRGSIIDIFSYTYDKPFRIDFFGDEVETIRSFNVENQLSERLFDNISIVTNLKENISNEQKVNLFTTLTQDYILWINDFEFVSNQIDLIHQNTIKNNPDKESEIISSEQFVYETANLSIIEFGIHFYFDADFSLHFSQSYQPHFNKNFDFLADNLIENQNKGYENYIISVNPKQIERLTDIFRDINEDITFTPVLANLHVGFIDHDLMICCYTDHQIFNRYHRFKLKESHSSKATIALKEINKLNQGDYIEHKDTLKDFISPIT